jgi:tRNA (guanine-N7-)-methyltransferase
LAGDDRPGAGTAPDGGPWRNFYGRRHGKTLRARQRSLLETQLAALAPPGIGRAKNPGRLPIDLAALFPGARAVWLEIGFGGGEHLLAQALANPGVGLIGCEPFVNGVAMFLSALDGQGVRNVAVHAGDVRFLFEVLPPACLGRVFLNYPDPWPKTRHRERRFFGPANLDSLAVLMQPGAELRLATDIPGYVAHAVKQGAPRADIVLDNPDPASWATPWPGWPGTRYEAKALREGRRPHYLTFRRSTVPAERHAPQEIS